MDTTDTEQLLLEMLGRRVIAFSPVLAQIAGSINAGLLLSQFLYWQRIVGVNKWFWKTAAEITEETTLTRWEQETARKRLIDLGILEEMRKGIPARMHYRVRMDELLKVLRQHTEGVSEKTADKNAMEQPARMLAGSKQDCCQTTNRIVGEQQTIQEITQENTYKITQEKQLREQRPRTSNKEEHISSIHQRIISDRGSAF